MKPGLVKQGMRRKQENSHLKWHNRAPLHILLNPYNIGPPLFPDISGVPDIERHCKQIPQTQYRHQQLKSIKNPRDGQTLEPDAFWVNFSRKSTTMTVGSCCRPSNQTHFTGRPPLVSQFTNRFPPLRLGVKYTMFNKHDTGKIVTVKQNTGSDSILRYHHPCLWSSSWSAVPLHLSILSHHNLLWAKFCGV